VRLLQVSTGRRHGPAGVPRWAAAPRPRRIRGHL